jgi:GPH family glycoside/pentoside/hexuronide:cation symporter
VGFDSNRPGGVQTAETIAGIKGCLVAIPLVGVTIALLLVLTFPLTQQKVAEIRAALEAKRGKI